MESPELDPSFFMDKPNVAEIHPTDVEIVHTWKEEHTKIRLRSSIFSFDSIHATLKEIFPLLESLRNAFPKDQGMIERANSIIELITYHEENIKLISESLNGESPQHHQGGLHTFFKLISINWNLLRDVLAWWKRDLDQKAQQTALIPVQWMRDRMYSILVSSSLGAFRIMSPRSLYDPLSVIPLTSARSYQGNKLDPNQNITRAQLIKEMDERKYELEQLNPALPLMLLILRERRKRIEEHFLSADHVELFQLDEIEKIPPISPFWYKYNVNTQRFSAVIYATYVTLAETQRGSHIFHKYANALTMAVRCTLDPHHATRVGHEVQSKDVDISILQSIWNLLDIPVVQAFTELRYPSIAVSQVLEIPTPIDGPLNGIPVTVRLISSKNLPFKLDHLLPRKTSYVKNLVKVFSTDSLRMLFTKALEGPNFQDVPEVPFILHFHGGGFVSGSSAMHENYLRDWAIISGVPIISVDYKLAPEHRFPIAIEECFYIYKWLLTSHSLGIRASSVAIVGDSAGGNLAAGILIKSIEEGLPIPEGAILVYPSLDMCRTCNPSRLLFKNDPLVPISVLKICRDAYFPPSIVEADIATQDGFAKNPLISPLHVSDAILSRFPPVYICVGEFDPLIDESLAFAKRLKAFSKLEKFQVYEGLPHGFLSITDKYVGEGAVAVRDTAENLKKILKIA